MRPNKARVTVGMRFETLGDLDEQSSTFAVTGWLHTRWVDPRLTFTKNDLLWLDFIDVPSGKVWDPLVAFQNAMPKTLSFVPEREGGVSIKIYPGVPPSEPNYLY